jgi:hypothetical protein
VVQPIIATYENGVFTPVEPLQLPEGFRVTLWLDPLTVQPSTDPNHPNLPYLEELAENRGEVLRRMGE